MESGGSNDAIHNQFGSDPYTIQIGCNIIHRQIELNTALLISIG